MAKEIEIFKKFFITITRPKFIITLIILTLIATFIGVFVPQVGDKSPSYFREWELTSPKTFYIVNLLQFNRVYTSVWFLALVFIIGVSLSITVRDQLSAAIKAYKYRGRPISPETFKNFVTLTTSSINDLNNIAEKIKAVLKSDNFKVSYEDRKETVTFVFLKKTIGRWGGFILHTGFLCIIIAALYNLALHQRGFVQIIETETFPGRSKDWLSTRQGLLADDFNLGYQVYLKRFIPKYWESDKIKSLQSDLILIDEHGNKEVALSVNKPLRYKGTTLYQSLDYGYALTFILYRYGGQPVVTHFLLDAPSRKDRPFVGKLDFALTDYIFSIKFYPNLNQPSFYLTFPGADVTIREKGKVLFKDRVLFNQNISLGKDTFHFAQIYYWSGIYFVKSSGLTLVYIGFTISTIGAFLIYFLIPKEIHVKVEREEAKTAIKIGGRARKYQALFADEFDKICQDIKTEIGSSIK